VPLPQRRAEPRSRRPQHVAYDLPDRFLDLVAAAQAGLAPSPSSQLSASASSGESCRAERAIHAIGSDANHAGKARSAVTVARSAIACRQADEQREYGGAACSSRVSSSRAASKADRPKRADPGRADRSRKSAPRLRTAPSSGDASAPRCLSGSAAAAPTSRGAVRRFGRLIQQAALAKARSALDEDDRTRPARMPASCSLISPNSASLPRSAVARGDARSDGSLLNLGPGHSHLRSKFAGRIARICDTASRAKCQRDQREALSHGATGSSEEQKET